MSSSTCTTNAFSPWGGCYTEKQSQCKFLVGSARVQSTVCQELPVERSMTRTPASVPLMVVMPVVC